MCNGNNQQPGLENAASLKVLRARTEADVADGRFPNPNLYLNIITTLASTNYEQYIQARMHTTMMSPCMYSRVEYAYYIVEYQLVCKLSIPYYQSRVVIILASIIVFHMHIMHTSHYVYYYQRVCICIRAIHTLVQYAYQLVVWIICIIL